MSQTASKKDIEIISWNLAFQKVAHSGMFFEQPSYILKVKESVEIFCYEISDSETVVMCKYPVSFFSRNNYPAFVYYDKSVLNKSIETLKFPLPKEFVTILDEEKESIKNIDVTYKDHILYFDSIMGTKFSKYILLSDLINIHPLIKNKKDELYFEKLLLSYSIIISKFLIEKKNGSFYLTKKNQGYSPYFIPCVKIGESIVNIYESIGIEELNESFDYYFERLLFNINPPLKDFKDVDVMEYLKRINKK